MLFQTTQAHEQLRAKIRAFAEEEVKPIAAGHLHKSGPGKLFENLVCKGLGDQLPLRRLRRCTALPIPQGAQQAQGIIGFAGNHSRSTPF